MNFNPSPISSGGNPPPAQPPPLKESLGRARRKRTLDVVLTFSILALLVGGAGAVFYYVFARGDGEAAEAPAVAAAGAGEARPAAAGAGETNWMEAAAAAASESARENPQPSPHLQAFVDSLSLAGIRTSSTGDRAIINGRVHGVGEKIPPTMELTLVRITSRQLTFRDELGFTYQRDF